MQEILKGLLDLLFPPRCRICNKACSEAICPECIDSFPRVNGSICTKCGKPCHREVNTCRECAGKNIYFLLARSAGDYSGNLKEAIHQLKFRNGKKLAPYLARFAAPYIVDFIDGIDCITFVPLTKYKEAKRGYNQSKLIAEEISKIFNKPICDNLIKIKNIPEQNKLGLAERPKNVKGAFGIKSPITGNMLLIDDVFTTGSTVNECARILKKNGAQNVFVLTIARTVPTGR